MSDMLGILNGCSQDIVDAPAANRDRCLGGGVEERSRECGLDPENNGLGVGCAGEIKDRLWLRPCAGELGIARPSGSIRLDNFCGL